MTLKEALNTQLNHLYYVVDNKTGNEIFSILITYDGIWKSIGFGQVEYDKTAVYVQSQFYQENFTKFILNIHDNIKNGVTSTDSLLYYINKFENITSWLEHTYKPRWEKELGNEFFEAVNKYIKHDLYLFCMTIDGVSAYESIINNNEKIWITNEVE